MDPTMDTIAELLTRDPYQLTKLDIDKIIDYYAERRKDFALTGKGQARTDRPKASLDDLGL